MLGQARGKTSLLSWPPAQPPAAGKQPSVLPATWWGQLASHLVGQKQFLFQPLAGGFCHPPVQKYSASLMARVVSDLMRLATAGGAAAQAAAREAASAALLEKSSSTPTDSHRGRTCWGGEEGASENNSAECSLLHGA